jgi:ketosteroid isomerase-like protein
LEAKTNDNGKPNDIKLLVLMVWQKQNKEWKLIARQAVKIIP